MQIRLFFVNLWNIVATFFRNQWEKLFGKPIPVAPPPPIVQEEIPEIHIGDTATNPEHRWIETRNPKGRKNGNGFREFGKTASVQEGGELTVVAVDGDNLLVSYKSPNGQGYGAEAGNGTLFFLPAHVFAHMTERYQRIQETRGQQKARVIALLRNTLAAETETPKPEAI